MKKEIQRALILTIFVLFGHIFNVSAVTVIGNSEASLLTATSTQIQWVTDVATMYSYITYGTISGATQYQYTASRYNQPCNTSTLSSAGTMAYTTTSTTTQCIKLINLLPATTYYYKTVTIPSTTQTPNGKKKEEKKNRESDSYLPVTSAEIHFTTLPLLPVLLPPLLPTAILSTSNGIPSVLISWKDASNNNSYTLITRATPGSTPTTFSLPTSESSYVDKEVSLDTTYTYTIQSCDTTRRCSSTTNPISITTPHSIITTPQIPDTPISFRAYVSTSSPTTINLIWGNSSKTQTKLEITKSLSSTANPTILTTLTDTSKTTYQDTVAATGTYTYGIRACNADLCSSNSTVSITVSSPSSPIPVSATFTAPYSTNLIWKDNSSDESFFKIFRGTSTANFSFLIDKEVNSTTYLDTNSTPGTYVYDIQACNILGCSPSSYFTQQVTIPQIINDPIVIPEITKVTPGLLTNVHVATTSATSIKISWYDTTNETLYKITKSINDGTPTLLFTTGANITSYVDINLIPGIYSYTIQACNDTVCSNAISSERILLAQSIKTTTSATTSPAVCMGFDDTCGIATTPVITPKEITIPPSPLSATAVRTYVGGLLSPNTIRINWANTSKNLTGFKIYRSSLSSSFEFPIITAQTTFYDDVNLAPGTYTYYVKACNEKGCSSSAAMTLPITISEITPIVLNNEETFSLHEISKAIGKLTPGTFINIISIGDTNTSNFLQKTFTATVGNDGSFKVKVPDGNYVVEGIIPVKIVSIIEGKVTKVTDKIITSTKNITGTVTFSDGKAVSNAQISAYKKETGDWFFGTTDSNGKYTIKASAGTWNIAVRQNSSVGNNWEASKVDTLVTFTNENNDEIKTANFTVLPVTSNLIVTVKDENNSPISSIGITLDTVSLSDSQSARLGTASRKVITEKTDVSGSVTLNVPAGKYFVRALTPTTLNYTQVPEMTTLLENNQTKTLNIILRKKVDLTTISKIGGVVKFNDGTLTDAFISAWSNEGKHTSLKTNAGGVFSFDVAVGETWHIKATKDAIGKSYASDEQTILTTTSSKVVDLTFVKSEAVSLPTTIVVQKNTTEESTISSDNGARFTLPANSVTSSGKVDISIKPTVEASSQSASTLVSTAYDITVKNTEGQKLTTLASPAEILIPYDEQELASKGVLLKDVVPSYYDENLNTWVSVPTFTINTLKKVFVLHVSHLTRFALIAAADTTAPSAPTNVVTDYVTPTDVRISWQNPVQDFNHVKIYRSENKNTFGDVISSEVFSNSFIDKTDSRAGKIFYYTIRAVDAAGNESGNLDQIAFISKGESLAQTKQNTSLLLPPGQEGVGQIMRLLSVGSKGDDVTSLQKALKLDGFYATGPITGYYGKLTENAVFRFQNYYKQELLIPNGYKIGTGVLGPITRKKINEIIINGVQ